MSPHGTRTQENFLIQILGKKILLRDWIAEDFDLYRSWQFGNHLWKELDGPYYQSSDQEIEKRLEVLKRKISENDFADLRSRLVVANRETNSLIGTVNAYWISQETHWLAAGITIYDPDNWGKGFGKEALGLWITYLFKSRPELVRLDLQTWSGNKGMEQLALSLGFKLEGCFRKARIVKGNYFDSLQFGILRDEWMQSNKS